MVPQTVEYKLSRWQVETNHPEHFRAVRRFSLAKASADDKALLGCGGLVMVGGSLLALGAAIHLLDALGRMARLGPGMVNWRETLISLVVWAVWGAVLWELWPKLRVLEARPGQLRFGIWRWEAAQIRWITMRRRRLESTATLWDSNISSAAGGSYVVLEITLHLGNGQARTVWRYGGRHKQRVEAWVQHMAQIAGVPVAESGTRAGVSA